MLTAFFTYIGVSPETAAKDACRIEHCISDETFLAMQKHAAQKSSVKTINNFNTASQATAARMFGGCCGVTAHMRI